mgnify:CR=1 FL=1
MIQLTGLRPTAVPTANRETYRSAGFTAPRRETLTKRLEQLTGRNEQREQVAATGN